MAILIRTDGHSSRVAPANGRSFTLAELHEFVGGYIEIVRVPPVDGGGLMVINEDGKRLDLPINYLATTGYHLGGGALDDYIVGNALIATRTELGEDDDEPEDDAT